MITCVHCKQEKPDNEFYNDKQKKTGKKPRCKPCDGLSRDKEKRRKYEREYWSGDRAAKKRAQVLASHYRNVEHYKKVRRQYLDTEAGKAKHRQYSAERRARLKNAFVEVVDFLEKYNEQNGLCYLCGVFFEMKDMEGDHIHPIAKGGEHSRENIAMACVYCNRSKGAKLLEELTYQMD